MNLTNTSLVLLIGACNLTWADDRAVALAPVTVEGRLEQPSGILLDEPIKSVGEFTVPVRLHREVTAHVRVNVNPETA